MSKLKKIIIETLMFLRLRLPMNRSSTEENSAMQCYDTVGTRFNESNLVENNAKRKPTNTPPASDRNDYFQCKKQRNTVLTMEKSPGQEQ